MKSSQSNFNLRSPSSYLARSYLIATVNDSTVIYDFLGESRIVILDEATSHLGARLNEKLDRAFRNQFKVQCILFRTVSS